MLNLPSQPGTVGLIILVGGALAGSLVLLLRDDVALRLGSSLGWRAVPSLLTASLALTVAVAPFTLWRVAEDIRRTAPITPEHARFVGAETKLVDGELVERIAALIPKTATYAVVIAPDSYVEIRQSLAQWLGYALIPRRQLRSWRAAEWVVVWGATLADLNVLATRPQLVGRNRLVDHEPVYVAQVPFAS